MCLAGIIFNGEDDAMIIETRPTYAGVTTRQLSCTGSGPTLVLIHGVGDSCETWRGVLRECAVRGHAAVAVDLPGFGQASPRSPGALLPQLDAFVAEVVHRNSAATGAAIAGNSLGAALAVRAASDPQVPLVGAVAIDAPGYRYRPVVSAVVLGPLAPIVFRLAARISLPPVLVRSTAVRHILATVLYGDHRKADLEVVERFATYTGDRVRLSELAHFGHHILRELRGGYPQPRVAPLLILHGTRDRLIPVSSSVSLHQQTPGSTLRVLPQLGHCPQLDDPALITALTLDFLRLQGLARAVAAVG